MRARSLFPVALSIRSASDALEIDRGGETIRKAIANGDLLAYSGPGKRVRILVTDLTEWVRQTWPLAKIKYRRTPDDHS